MVIATWFYTGFIPPLAGPGMAGTYGSFFAIPHCLLAIYFSRLVGDGLESIFLAHYIYIMMGTFLIGILCVSVAEEEMGPMTDWRGRKKDRDQNQIVIDEVVGMMVTYAFVDWRGIGLLSWEAFWIMLAGFVLFRAFDIVKVWPTRYFDNMKNPAGVMLDDVVAGLQAGIVLGVIHSFFG